MTARLAPVRWKLLQKEGVVHVLHLFKWSLFPIKMAQLEAGSKAKDGDGFVSK